jgi:hypothetical protein
MAQIVLIGGLAIWELTHFIVVICSGYLAYCHRLLRKSGLIFLAIFSNIRIICYSAQIAAMVAKSDTAKIVAIILHSLELSPLLLAILDGLSQA